MEARDQHKTGNKCTTRRGCAGGRGRLHTSTARSCARHLADTFAVLCEMRQTFTVLIKIKRSRKKNDSRWFVG